MRPRWRSDLSVPEQSALRRCGRERDTRDLSKLAVDHDRAQKFLIYSFEVCDVAQARAAAARGLVLRERVQAATGALTASYEYEEEGTSR